MLHSFFIMWMAASASKVTVYVVALSMVRHRQHYYSSL